MGARVAFPVVTGLALTDGSEQSVSIEDLAPYDSGVIYFVAEDVGAGYSPTLAAWAFDVVDPVTGVIITSVASGSNVALQDQGGGVYSLGVSVGSLTGVKYQLNFALATVGGVSPSATMSATFIGQT